MPDLLYRNPADRQVMVLIPAGPAVFGSRDDDPDAYDTEKPQFEAELPGYYMGTACVTNTEYAAFLSAVHPGDADVQKWIELGRSCHLVRNDAGYGVDDIEGSGEHPVVQVSWYGAVAYCEWAGLRLPSELEWEKAARGPQGKVYPWGDEWAPELCRHSWNRGGEETCEVWGYPRGVSVYGMYNISGNVWEWCADWYEADAYRRYAAGDLTPAREGTSRVIRGGSWYYEYPRYFRCADRGNGDPSYRCYDRGFRCARGLGGGG